MSQDMPKSGTYYPLLAALLFILYFHSTWAELQMAYLQRSHAKIGAYVQKGFAPDYVRPLESHQRSRRDVTSNVLHRSDVIPENVKYDQDLADLGAILPNRTFSIEGNSLDIPDMFIVTAEFKLRLNSTMSEVNRKKFDFDIHPSIDVNIVATSVDNSSDEVTLTVQLILSDVNDEPPEFVSQPRPFLATMAETAQAGTVLYTLSVKDVDIDPDVTLRIASVSPSSGIGRFRLDVTRSGNVWKASVVTVGNDNFDSSVEYNIEVTATDSNTEEGERMTTDSVKVLVGWRPPQFYAPKISCFIEESVSNSDRNRVSTVNNVPFEVKTVSFQKRGVTYQILESNGTLTRRFQMDDNGHIFNTEVIDYESIRIINLKIRATESGTSLTSLCELKINVKDENDNNPIFSQSLYHKSVPEDIVTGSNILTVTASDLDSEQNGELQFSILNSDFFEISAAEKVDMNKYKANIKVKRELDYDNILDPTYTMEVFVTDKGTPPLTSTTQASIYVTNANDNAPTFDNSSTIIPLLETAEPGYSVVVLQASDLDGDHVSFSFPENRETYEIFKIERDSRILKTISNIPSDRDSFSLPIQAIDDGSCCSPKIRQTSEVNFTVTIEGVNAHKPNFVNCSNYDMEASVIEKAVIGTPVIQVQASDPDRGENGRILYAIVTSELKFSFAIDEETGNITVIREDIKNDLKDYIEVTVTGENPVKGQPLKGWCTFRVRIEDINDHSPVFSQELYEHEIPDSMMPHSIIGQIVATDEDKGINAKLTYSLVPNDVFDIDPQSGVVSLVALLPSQPPSPSSVDGASFYLTVKVEDGGYPVKQSGQTVLHIKIITEQIPPSWVDSHPDLAEFNVSEDTSTDSTITSFRCRSNIPNNPKVEFIVYNSVKSIQQASRTFYPDKNGDRMNLKLLKALDYEMKKQYQITVVCQNFGASNMQVSKNIIINILDANDEFPRFVGLSLNVGRYEGSVAEDAAPGSTVVAVSANDDDTDINFATVAFQIGDGREDQRFFDVVPDNNAVNRAYIVTKPNLQLDRETKDHYVINVIAYDNPSDRNNSNLDRRLVHISVTDVNDNPPVFERSLYQHNVSETAPINSIIFAVTADDNDTVDQNLGLNYYFKEGTESNPFTVRPVTGEIMVSGELDYEGNHKMYRLNLVATDQYRLHTASTVVQMFVTDENDNRPVFDRSSYDVSGMVVEEDLTNSQTSPLYLIQVFATDRDENSVIEYSLVDPAVPFTINKQTGRIYLIGVLDRDGPTPDYKLTVKAQDSPRDPLVSYADVTVWPMDINDNDPVFDLPFSGSVLEHPDPGITVMTVVARDKDLGLNGTVEYQLDPSQPIPAYSQHFIIEQTSGNIITSSSSRQLDREKTDQVLLSIVANDLGNPKRSSSTTVTITVLDKNDEPPYFPEPAYQILAAENRKGQIGLIQPKDKDTDHKNKNFQFSLEGAPRHFSVTRQNNAASINIKETDPIDYDAGVDNRAFEFTLKVNDGEASHVAETRVKVIITDVNDNAPDFVDDEIKVTFLDGTKRGTFMAQFNASDKDEGMNSEIIFSVTRESDPRYEFYIDPVTGIVTARKELDREKEEIIDLTIVATDKGKPPLSSHARLLVTLSDVNDNAPQFKEDYKPVVKENVVHKDKTVVEIFAKDPDSPTFGPPFGFKLPDDCTESSCRYFQLEINKDGDNGRGTALIKTSTTFDREENDKYFLPIVMWDMRDKNDARSLTATSTLSIVIGDDNDNKHKAGHQDLFVYNYEGLTKPYDIGRVYADDPDHWDTPGKIYKFRSPEIMNSYFTVLEDTGVIQMKDGVPSNVDNDRPAYEFKVDVFDRKWGNTETCTVSVYVKTLPEQAVWKSGSMRLIGISAEDFIAKEKFGQSRYDKFRRKLASVLGYPNINNVDVVSLMGHENHLDVRFSAHGSPYLNPAQVESAVMLHQHEFEKEMGAKIAQLPINLCLEEIYDDGCYTQLNVTGLSNMVNARGTSFVGVQTFTAPVSGCRDCTFPEPVECRADYCYNGGTCIKDDWNKIVCSCPENFDGPRCQQRRHSFSGSSIAFYEALSICANGRTSFEFITTDKNGLIMSGMSEISGDVLKARDDYILVELVNGYPRLRVNLGAGELILTLDEAHSMKALKLDDGKWHHIDIDKSGKNIMLTIDKCIKGEVKDNRLNDTSCSIAGIIPGPDILVNTQGFLQIGGLYPHTRNVSSFPSIQSRGFSGCIKNLMHNSKLYDLHYKNIPGWNSGENHCPREDVICKPNGNAVCGEKADCISAWKPQARVVLCQCHPGWHGDKCREESVIKDLGTLSFFKWELTADAINQAAREHSLQMMFRTRQATGTLFAMTSVNKKTILLQLVDSKLTLFYDLGDGQQTLILGQADASSGQWHNVRVDRYGSEFSISMDNGEGRNYNYRLRSKDSDANFTASPIISAGARVPPERDNVTELTYDLISTCIRDIRFNGNYLPLEHSENSLSKAASLLDSQNINDNCTRKDCVTPNCPPNYVCHPLWEREECRCIDGRYESGPWMCAPLCDLKPCYNGGKCTLVGGQVTCACQNPWEGKLCNVIVQEVDSEDDSLLAGEIAGITIGILILIVIIILLILWIVWYQCRNQDDEKIADDSLDDENFAKENIMFHEEECAGEEDHEGFDLSILRMPEMKTNAKPVEVLAPTKELKTNAPNPGADTPLPPGVGQFIAQKMDDMGDEDVDTTKEYNYEGTNSEADSLSSLSASSHSSVTPDYDYLNDWGPKFSRLADIYGAGPEQEYV